MTMLRSRPCFRFEGIILTAWLACVGGCGLERQGFSARSVVVGELRCEYLRDPLGLDVQSPRLSWVLASNDPARRGLCQTAYQMLVASKPEILASGRGDLWDTGEVTFSDSVNVPYKGKALHSGQQCLWKVRVRDDKGVWSGWSRPGRWTMGLLSSSDWSAQWIGTDEVFVRRQGWPPPDNNMPDPWFRRTIDLDAKPGRAVAYVASIGYHELYINGRKVGDAVLVPSVTDNSKRARYVTYEIADYLRPGTNVIGLWLGVSWAIFPKFETPDKPRTPLVMAQIDVEMPGGKVVRLGTDGQWKTHPSPNTLLGVWDFMHFGGERYDAGREVPLWCSTGLDEAGWRQARVFRPKVVVSADKIEPDRLVKAIRPMAITEVSPGVVQVDMGVNFAGWIELDVSGRPGARVDLEFSERQAVAMTHRLHSAYIIGPSGKGTFRNRFNYGVGRWITIRGLQAKPSAEQVRGWLVRTDYARAGHFECDNDLLNRIYDVTLWTFENLSLGGYVVDCPHRERMGYGGDAHATTRTALDNYSLAAFYTKWAEDWRDVQGSASAWGTEKAEGQAGGGGKIEPGNLPYTAPTYWGGGGPAWSGFCITLPWEVYRRYGDTRILEENFPMMQRWLEFLETKAKDDLLVRWGGEWDFLGDWLWPGAKGVNGDTPETLFFNNCYWIYNLQTAARVAELLGQQEAAARYHLRAETVAKAAHGRFFQPADSSYVNGMPAYLAIALLVGVPLQDVRPAVWKRLEQEILVNRKGHIWAGITGGAFLMKTLLEEGRNDLIYEMVRQEDYPGWGDQLRRGATTFWESWDDDPGLSYLHSSCLYEGSWFIEGLAGIRPDPDRAGFKHFVIRPGVMEGRGPAKVSASTESLYGPVRSAWRTTADGLELDVTIPANTTATIVIPCPSSSDVLEAGLPPSQARGILKTQFQKDCVLLDVSAGTYHFTCHRKEKSL